MANIILADDDAVALDLLARTLTAEGHRIERCSDGQQALKILEAAPRKYDLLVSDVQMPTLDGITLAERALLAAPHLKVLLMSGYAGELARARNLNESAVRCVSKPLSLEDLRAHVRAVLA